MELLALTVATAPIPMAAMLTTAHLGLQTLQTVHEPRASMNGCEPLDNFSYIP